MRGVSAHLPSRTPKEGALAPAPSHTSLGDIVVTSKKAAKRQLYPTPALLPPTPCPTIAYLLAPQTSPGDCPLLPSWLLATSLSRVLCPVASLPNFSWGGESGPRPLPLLLPPGIPKASLDEQGRDTVPLFAVGHQAEWQAGREAEEETPPQAAQMTNRFPHFLVYPIAALIQALSSTFLPAPRPALSQAHCLAQGNSDAP